MRILLAILFWTTPLLADWGRIDAVMRDQLADESQLDAVVAVQQGDRITARYYGAADRHSLFEIGSLTKTMTGTLLAILSARGTVGLDDALAKHLPELRGLPVGSVTLRQLATHTAGLPRALPDLALPPIDPLNPYRYYDLPRAVAAFRTIAVSPVGEFRAENYSNVGMGLLGLALARADGRDYRALLREEVLVPLGMRHSGVGVSTRLLAAHNELLEPVPAWDFTSLWEAAGGVRSTPADMMRYLDANLHPERTPLAAAIRTAHALQVRGPKLGIGLAWIRQGNDSIWHNGQTGGFNSLLEVRPGMERGLLVLNDTALPVRCVREIAFGADCRIDDGYALSTTERDRLEGTYRFDEGPELVISHAGQRLIGELRGAGPAASGRARLWAVTATRLITSQRTLDLQFDGTGSTIDRVTVTVQGTQAVGRRVR